MSRSSTDPVNASPDLTSLALPKHIGIAGVSVEGVLLCARIIQAEADRLSPERRPQVVLHMHPFVRYSSAMAAGNLAAVADLLINSVGRLQAAGAEFALIPANAAHLVIDEVMRRSGIPVLNLVEIVAQETHRRGFKRLAILGVQWTMRSGLYDAALRRLGIEPVLPGDADQTAIHEIIMEELMAGQIRAASTARLVGIVERLRSQGCPGVALACTELPLTLNEGNCGPDTIDTTRLLAEHALAYSLGEVIPPQP